MQIKQILGPTILVQIVDVDCNEIKMKKANTVFSSMEKNTDVFKKVLHLPPVNLPVVYIKHHIYLPCKYVFPNVRS